MQQIPDKSVDAIITDPPYGTTELKWDKVIDWTAFWEQAKRVMKQPTSLVIMFAAQPFATDLIVSNRTWFRYELIWEKTIASGFLDAKKRPLRAHENILVFSDKWKGATYNPQKTPGTKYTEKRTGKRSQHYNKSKSITIFDERCDRYPRTVLRYPTVQKIGHPTTKPIDLVSWLVLSYTNKDDLVLDPFSGSGTTALACLKNNRNFIAIEKEEKYCELARRRLNEYESNNSSII
ncbi:DNA methylase N-4/N-6 domain protein [Calothrix sp. PCC 7716]|nr:DNA methylase N-4/N-6 domain protein [Calothrix sp. PCC 7716]